MGFAACNSVTIQRLPPCGEQTDALDDPDPCRFDGRRAGAGRACLRGRERFPPAARKYPAAAGHRPTGSRRPGRAGIAPPGANPDADPASARPDTRPNRLGTQRRWLQSFGTSDALAINARTGSRTEPNRGAGIAPGWGHSSWRTGYQGHSTHHSNSDLCRRACKRTGRAGRRFDLALGFRRPGRTRSTRRSRLNVAASAGRRASRCAGCRAAEPHTRASSGTEACRARRARPGRAPADHARATAPKSHADERHSRLPP